MNATKGQALAANVYQACNDEYRKGVLFNREKLFSSRKHVVKVRGDKLDILIDKDAEDVDEIFQSKGVALPPDNVLEGIKPSDVTIPVKYREDFSEEMQLPSSDLLKVLHYYGSKKVSAEAEAQRMIRSMDETALLGFGMMVEEWVNELVEEESGRFFLENDDTAESRDVVYESQEDVEEDDSANESSGNSD